MAASSMQNVANLFQALDTKTAVCEKHGEYKSDLMRFPGRADPVWSGCMGCQREQVEQENKAMAQEARRQMEQSKVNQILGRAAIPQRFMDRSLDNYVVENDGQRKAIATALRYVENWTDNRSAGRCLIMMGPPGTGKTHIAIGIARKVLELNGTAMYVRAHEAISRIMETYRRDSPQTERQVLDSFRKPDLLIIDEIGRQRGTDNERMMLFEIINRRYDDEKPTIIISNLDKDGIEHYMDEATIDRLRERNGIGVVFDWESYRSKM